MQAVKSHMNKFVGCGEVESSGDKLTHTLDIPVIKERENS
jgi:hypothetical protein